MIISPWLRRGEIWQWAGSYKYKKAATAFIVLSLVIVLIHRAASTKNSTQSLLTRSPGIVPQGNQDTSKRAQKTAPYGVQKAPYGVQNTSTEPRDTPRQIILFAYMRGGSEFTGKLLSLQDNTFYWYEFFWDVYNSMVSSTQTSSLPQRIAFDSNSGKLRNITNYEREFIRNQTRLMFNCELDKMPAEATTSWTLFKGLGGAHEYVKCLHKHNARDVFRNKCQGQLHAKCASYMSNSLSNGCHIYMEKTRLAVAGHAVEDMPGFPAIAPYVSCGEPIRRATETCLPSLIKECKKKPVKISKIIRGNMTSMADILKDFPRLKVIHMLRDPRGIILSRRNSFLPGLNYEHEARFLCAKMREDIRQRQALEERYPGVTMAIIYEELAKDASGVVEEVYKFAGIGMTDATKAWLRAHTSTSYDVATGWKQRIQKDVKDIIDSQCSELYKITPYGT